jgi:hypothetical protein
MTQQQKGWIFYAKVLPERASISLRGLDYTVHVASELGFKCRFEKVVLIDSQIIARATLVEGNTDIFTVRNALAQHLRNLADLAGFQTGRHLDVEITSAVSTTDPEDWVIFGNTIPALFKESADLTLDMLQVALTDTPLSMALADFRKSMPDGTETGFYCFRAIEAVMQSFAVEGDSDIKRWERMRGALRIERGAIDFVKGHADDRRHGRVSPTITDAQRQKVFKTAHVIIDRYLALKIQKAEELDSSKYPMITGSDF